MSHFSGESDFYDTLCGIKMYDKGNYYASDEFECFEIFKQQTGGIIYQTYPVKVSSYNLTFVANHCDHFSYTKTTKIVRDKRYATGEKEITEYTYTYFDKTYTNLKDLNKQNVFVTIGIHFDTIFDLVPYYGHNVVAMTFSKDTNKRVVVISNDSIPSTLFRNELMHGLCAPYPDYFIKNLTSHYLDLAQKYYFKDLEKRTKLASLTDLVESGSKKNFYELALPTAIDYMHSVKYIFTDNKQYNYMGYPVLKDDHTILIPKYDVDNVFPELIKNDIVKIQYVEKMEFENEAKYGAKAGSILGDN